MKICTNTSTKENSYSRLQEKQYWNVDYQLKVIFNKEHDYIDQGDDVRTFI